MTTIYSPSDKGFDERLSTIDRCQIALLREFSGQFGSGRLILKGGMAMRAVFGNMRLTKDIDFDRDLSLSIGALKTGAPKGLMRAAANAGIRGGIATITKATDTTIRVRLEGKSIGGVDLRFDVEISGRGVPPALYRRREVIVPPAAYGIAPFSVETYKNEMLAAMKISAAMSDARNAPRDIYDLYGLALSGVNPVEILSNQTHELLIDIKANVLNKIVLISYELAREELVPYLPPDERLLLTEDVWLNYTITVGQAIEDWCSLAIEGQGTQGEAEAERNRDEVPP